VNKKSSFLNFTQAIKGVNLGESYFLAGGLGLKQNLTYLMSFNDNNGKVIIEDMPPMSSSRILHNMLYIPKIDIVFVCGGKNNKTAEFINLPLKEWSTVKDMTKARQNACLALINEKYIYCISGFESESEAYLNSCEYYDLDSYERDPAWVLIDFDKMKLVYRMSTPGIIQLSDD
jgi:hypothetical protein